MADELYRGNQRRSFYRLKYPPDQAPRVLINNVPYGIIDISENGLKISNPFRHRMPDDLFSMVVHLHEGEPIKVVARVIRIEPGMIAFYLVHGIPYKRILSEQAYLKNVQNKA